MLTGKLEDVKQELREKYNAEWLKKYKGFEKLSKQKAEEVVECMIELSVLLCHYKLNQQKRAA